MTDGFKDLDKHAIKSKTSWIESGSGTANELATIDWAKIVGLILTLLKTQLPEKTYRLFSFLATLLLKKRSKLSMFIFGSAFISVQVIGIYKLILIVINLF